jgi:hypothetical protein
MKIPNPLSPDQMTDAERLDEAAEILARGILRLRARKRAAPTVLSADCGDRCLDFSADQCGYVRRNLTETDDE